MMVDVDVILEVGGTVDVGVVVDVEEVVNSVVGQDAVFNKKNKLLVYEFGNVILYESFIIFTM